MPGQRIDWRRAKAAPLPVGPISPEIGVTEAREDVEALERIAEQRKNGRKGKRPSALPSFTRGSELDRLVGRMFGSLSLRQFAFQLENAPPSIRRAFRCPSKSVSFWITRTHGLSILLSRSQDGRTRILKVSEKVLRESESEVIFHLLQLLEQRTEGAENG